MKVLKVINTVALASMVVVNIVANVLPIGGNSTGEVSLLYENMFTPAPITFAIWGVIYIMMAAFVLYQWEIVDAGPKNAELRESIGMWFAISCAMNIGWIFAWHYRAIELSVLLIIGLLFSLIMIQRSIGNRAEDSMLRKIAVGVGFDIYFGWIIAATIANISAMLTKLKWDGFGLSDEFWMVAVVIVGAFIGAMTVIVSGKWISALAVVWAYVGILIEHISSGGYAGKYPWAIASVLVGIVIMLSAIVIKQWSRITNRKNNRHNYARISY